MAKTLLLALWCGLAHSAQLCPTLSVGAGLTESAQKHIWTLQLLCPVGRGIAVGAKISLQSQKELGAYALCAPQPFGGRRVKLLLPVWFGARVPIGGRLSSADADLALGAQTELYLTPQIFAQLGGAFALLEKGYEVGVSLGYRFNFPDADGDWISDGDDRCPNTPRGARVDDRGCGIDSDGDGVYDGLDRCPQTPLAALVDSLGCPRDSDGDGVYDGADRCPETPRDIPVDTTGCPKDTDGDGVPDYADSCSQTPKGAVVDRAGCPIDTDEDGVPDGIDQCDGTPTGFEVDRFGCPKVPMLNGETVHNLFDDALELTAFALNHLQRIAKRIRAYPDRKTVIEVYTDTEGSFQYNRNRARAVGRKIVDFLESQGVDPDCVEIVPMGEKDPVARGWSAQAKRKNRRAVFYMRKPEAQKAGG